MFNEVENEFIFSSRVKLYFNYGIMFNEVENEFILSSTRAMQIQN